MRVLPLLDLIGPRLPLLKSYSFSILVPFRLGRAARRDDANLVSPVGIRHHQYSSKCISANWQESTFTRRAYVRNRDRKLVVEHRLYVRKIDSMFRQVGSRLGRIPLSFHSNKVCIIYAYVKVPDSGVNANSLPPKPGTSFVPGQVPFLPESNGF